MIREIVRKAVLLESKGMSEANSVNSLLMHDMYAEADMGFGRALLRLRAEEMNNPNKGETEKRAYKLTKIEEVPIASGGVQVKTLSPGTNTISTISTVADLHAIVNRNDAEFRTIEATPNMLDPDGTPKVVYHGTNGGDFNVFDWGHTQRADAGRHAQ